MTMHNKRRNNMGGGNGGQHRHHNNRGPRRFGSGSRPPGGEGGNDPASIARTRRNATQNREKYQAMAHDATRNGDRVQAEYYLQHADHYHRVLLALPPEEAPRPQYIRGFGPDGAQMNGGQGQPEAQQGEQAGGNTETMQPSGALPSFITQPSVGGAEE